MGLRIVVAALAAAVAVPGCAGGGGDAASTPDSTDSSPSPQARVDGDTADGGAGDARTGTVDPQVLALGPGDVPEGFSAASLDPETGESLAPDECPELDELEVQDEVGLVYESDDRSQFVEIRVAPREQGDKIIALLGELGECPDTLFSDEEGTRFDIRFDGLAIPRGQGATITGTAGGFPFVSQFAAFETGGHLVTLNVLGLGGLPDGVDVAALAQLTIDRGNGAAAPAPAAPTMVEPGQPLATADDGEAEDGDQVAAAVGTRDAPLTVGQTATVGPDWEVTVDEIRLHATDEMLAANQFNNEPENGNYALVTLTTTYVGDDEGNAGFDLSVVLSGADRRQYRDSDCAASEPEPMSDQPTVESSGTVTGQFCLDYPDNALGEGAVLFIEPTLSFDEIRVFWALPTG